MTASALAGEMPRISVRRSGCRSSTSRVLSPNLSTIRAAVAGPMPLTACPARYLYMSSFVRGRLRSAYSLLNWRPWFG